MEIKKHKTVPEIKGILRSHVIEVPSCIRDCSGIKIFGKRVSELYSTENDFIIPYSSTYQNMEKAYITGNASREEILQDAEKLSLDMNLVNDFMSQDNEVEDEDNDEELFLIINAKRG